MLNDPSAGTILSGCNWCRFWGFTPSIILTLGIYREWIISARMYSRLPLITLMSIPYSNMLWITIILICTRAGLMGSKLRYIRWCEFYRGKIRTFIIIFRLKKYRANTFCSPGQSLSGEKCQVNCVGFYGMAS